MVVTIKFADVAQHYEGKLHQIAALEYLDEQIDYMLEICENTGELCEVRAALENFQVIWRNNAPPPPETTTSILALADPLIAAVPTDIAGPNSQTRQDYARESIPYLLESCEKHGVTDYSHIAYIMGTVSHESIFGRYMQEIWGPTAVQRGYEGRSDLGNTQTGDGYKYRGRGYVQITGRANYDKFSEVLGVDLVNHPELTEEPLNAADICVLGMSRGLFTGVGLSTYGIDGAFDWYNARRTVNGVDRAELIAGYGQHYRNAIA